jgi:hypothetical protein
LGTGAGNDTGPGADLRRTALFAVWDDDDALDRYLDRTAARRANAEESYVVRMRAVRGHGRWGGFDVLGALAPAETGADHAVAVITRARVRVRHWRSFSRASRIVSEELRRTPGLLAVCGIGEAPVGRLGTFSLWRGASDARDFAYRTPRHLEVVKRTQADGWYAEELFATFAPYSSSGTWGGTDPISAIPPAGATTPG